ncbi:unnamed protein product [Arctogadus glacialis]
MPSSHTHLADAYSCEGGGGSQFLEAAACQRRDAGSGGEICTHAGGAEVWRKKEDTEEEGHHKFDESVGDPGGGWDYVEIGGERNSSVAAGTDRETSHKRSD